MKEEYNLGDKKWEFLLNQKIWNIPVRDFLSKLDFAFVNLKFFYFNPKGANSVNLMPTIRYLSEEIKDEKLKDNFYNECFGRLFSLGGFDLLAKKISELEKTKTMNF